MLMKIVSIANNDHKVALHIHIKLSHLELYFLINLIYSYCFIILVGCFYNIPSYFSIFFLPLFYFFFNFFLSI